MSYTQSLYHVVLRTKNNVQAIPQEKASALYRYIWGIIKNKKGVLHRINGIEDHIHIAFDLHPTVALTSFIKDIKVATSLWMKNNPDFPLFEGWSLGYCALTYSYTQKDTIINYIKNQQEHHKEESSRDEIIRILEEEGIQFDKQCLQ